MESNVSLSERLLEQIESILKDLIDKTNAQCVILADISGQLISVEGHLEEGNLAQVTALAAGDMAVLTELSRQIGEEEPHGSFLHEGQHKSLYLFNVGGSFILIVVFPNELPVGLIRLFVRRAAERLYPLTDEFEEVMKQPTHLLGADFGVDLANELEKVFME